MQETNKRAFKGVWIPREVWEAKDLGWSEKMLLVEIDSLDNAEGCFARNEYFANFLELSKDRVSKMISGLKDKGYITVDFTYRAGTKQIEKRTIRIVKEKYHGIDIPIGKNTDTYRQKQREGLGENTKDNNTVFNNTSNNTNYINTNQPNNLIQQDSVLERDLGWGQVVNFYHANKHTAPIPVVYEKLGIMYDLYPIAELVQEALQIAVLNHARNHIHYAEPILLRWRSQNIRTVEHARFEQQKEGQAHASNQHQPGRIPEKTRSQSIGDESIRSKLRNFSSQQN